MKAASVQISHFIQSRCVPVVLFVVVAFLSTTALQGHVWSRLVPEAPVVETLKAVKFMSI
jgi:hypothetical protein